MTGITQIVLTGAESVSGFKGKLTRYNSLTFSGSAAGITLQPGDQNLMSSLSIGNLAPVQTSAFTIEYWVKFKNLSFLNSIVHQNGQATIASPSLYGGLALFHTANRFLVHNYLIANNSFTIPSEASPSQNWELDVWYHIMLIRNPSNFISLFVNGFQTPSGAPFNTNSYGVNPTLIGTWRNTYGFGTTNNLIGNLYNIKYTVGQAQHDPNAATIPIPQVPNVSITNDTKLLMLSPNNNAFKDETGLCTIGIRAGSVTQSKSTPFNDEVTLNGAIAKISSPFSNFQSGSISFSGATTSYATYAGSNGMNFGAGNFCIEWFSYSTDSNAQSTVWWYGSTLSPTIGMAFEDFIGLININLYIGGSNLTLATVTKDTYYKLWTHWALVRLSGNIYLFKNGTIANPGGTPDTTNLNDVSSTFYIGKMGASATNNQCFGGLITNLRITKGNSVYTGNFTKPNANLTRIQSANRFGGSNTNSIRSYQVPYLMVP